MKLASEINLCTNFIHLFISDGRVQCIHLATSYDTHLIRIEVYRGPSGWEDMGVINGFETTEGLDKEKGHQRKFDM